MIGRGYFALIDGYNGREKADTEAANDSAYDHGPKPKRERLDGAAQCEDQSADEQSALSTYDVPHPASSDGSDECTNFKYSDHGPDLYWSWMIEIAGEVWSCDDSTHDALVIAKQEDTQASKYGDGIEQRLPDEAASSETVAVIVHHAALEGVRCGVLVELNTMVDVGDEG